MSLFRRDTVWLGVLAALVRLAAYTAHRQSPFGAAPILDAELYDTWARELAAGNWLGGDVYFANPLYPHVLAVVYAITQGSAEVARLFQHALGVATVLIIHAFTRTAFDRAAASVSGVFAALYLPFIAFEDTLLIATLGAFLTALALLLAIRARPAGGGAWLAAGVVAGLSLLARPTLLPLAIAGWACLGGDHRRQRFMRRAMPWLAGVLLAVLPVTARNVAVSGQLVWITTHGGETFYVGNRSGADGSNLQPEFVRSGPRFEHEDYRREASRRLGREVDLATASRYWRNQALEFIATQPRAYARLQLRKLGLVFHAYEKGDNLDLESRRRVIPLYRLPWPGFGLVGALGLSGLVLWSVAAARSGRGPPSRLMRAIEGKIDHSVAALLALAVAAVVLSLLLYFVTARYRLPMVVPLLAFAGFAAVALARAVRRAPYVAWQPAILIIVVFAVLHRPLGAQDRNNPSLAATNLGFLYEVAGDFESARREYRRAAALDPRNALAYFNLGVVERRSGSFGAAAAALERAIALAPGYADAYEQLGMVLEQQGELDAALARYQQAIALEPGRALFYRDLGRLHLLRGEHREAIRAWRRALELDPADTATRQRLVRLEHELAPP